MSICHSGTTYAEINAREQISNVIREAGFSDFMALQILFKKKGHPSLTGGPDLKPVNYEKQVYSPEEGVSSITPVENFNGVLLPAGEILIYPDISWCSAEQKSVQ